MRKIGFHFKLKEALPTWRDYEFNVGYEICCLGRKREPNRIEFAWFYVKCFFTVFRCWLVRHDIKEGGYAGPDSGEITWECKRCGWGGHHTLY